MWSSKSCLNSSIKLIPSIQSSSQHHPMLTHSLLKLQQWISLLPHLLIIWDLQDLIMKDLKEDPQEMNLLLCELNLKILLKLKLDLMDQEDQEEISRRRDVERKRILQRKKVKTNQKVRRSITKEERSIASLENASLDYFSCSGDS